MFKQRLLRLLIFTLVVGLIFLWLAGLEKKERKILPAQAEEKMELAKDFFEEKKVGEKVLGAARKWLPDLPGLKMAGPEKKVEEKINKMIEELKSLPEDQLNEVKKAVFCSQVCERSCEELCQ